MLNTPGKRKFPAMQSDELKIEIIDRLREKGKKHFF